MALAQLQPRLTLQANCNHPDPSAGLDSPAIMRHDFDFLLLQLVRSPNTGEPVRILSYQESNSEQRRTRPLFSSTRRTICPLEVNLQYLQSI